MRGILDTYEGPLTRYAARITGDVETAREVAQETFMRLCDQDPAALNGRLAPWLFTVCRRKAIDVQRKENRMATVAEPEAPTTSGERNDPAGIVQRREESGYVLDALAELSSDQQDAIRLRFQNGLGYKEIAAVTGLTIGNVGYLIHTAIGRIRAAVGADGTPSQRRSDETSQPRNVDAPASEPRP